MFDISDLVYHTAHDYPGGVLALAGRMCVSPNVLNKKVSPKETHHKLTLDEAVKMVELTGDDRIADGFAELVGGVIVKTANFSGISDTALLETYTNLMAQLGIFSGDFNKTLTDGKITPDELKMLQADLYHMQAAGAELMARIATLVEE